jgi:hypothetical protein
MQLLPAPAVLVVGDFHTGRRQFAEAAFAAVAKAYQSRGAQFGAAWQDFDNIPAGIEAREQDRAAAPALYPIAVSDNGNADAEDLRVKLHNLFLRFDVWGVIAATTSRNTPGLLRKLMHSDVPVLLTVDSALTGLERGPNILRLGPNNGQQAQAILAKLMELRASNAPPADPVQVIYAPLGDRYVEDLYIALAALAQQARLPLVGSHEARAVVRSVAPVVFVGYAPEFLTVISELGNSFVAPIILSDGCYGDSKVIGIGGSKALVWCRSLFDLSTYAHSGYCAIYEQWKRVGRTSSEVIRSGLSPADKLRPFIRLLRQQLEQSKDVFTFEGLDNQRGGYVVEDVSGAPTGAGS